MSKVFEAYATRRGIAKQSMRFMIDGARVDESSTPADLDLEDGDQIDVVLEQTGGR